MYSCHGFAKICLPGKNQNITFIKLESSINYVKYGFIMTVCRLS